MGIVLLAATAAQAGPANVVRLDGQCGIGWFGCPSEVAILLPDGSYTCPADGVDLVIIGGDGHLVGTNNPRGNLNFQCKARIDFSAINATGPVGGDQEVVALPIENVCVFLPDACQDDGAFIANPRTVGELAVCLVADTATTRMQEIVSPDGNVTLHCHLPDASLAEGLPLANTEVDDEKASEGTRVELNRR